MAETLLPCPRCGAIPKPVEYWTTGGMTAHSLCCDCGSPSFVGPVGELPAEAIEWWNTRAACPRCAALEADLGQAHHVLDILGIPRKTNDDGSTLTLLGRMRAVQVELADLRLERQEKQEQSK